MKYISLVLFLTLFFSSGCISSSWEINQIETTFLNEENRSEFVQRNAILLDTKTGQTWVFESDGDSKYMWVKLPKHKEMGK